MTRYRWREPRTDEHTFVVRKEGKTFWGPFESRPLYWKLRPRNRIRGQCPLGCSVISTSTCACVGTMEESMSSTGRVRPQSVTRTARRSPSGMIVRRDAGLRFMHARRLQTSPAGDHGIDDFCGVLAPRTFAHCYFRRRPVEPVPRREFIARSMSSSSYHHRFFILECVYPLLCSGSPARGAPNCGGAVLELEQV